MTVPSNPAERCHPGHCGTSHAGFKALVTTQALGALNALKEVDPALLLEAMRDPHPLVRREAARLCETRIGKDADLAVFDPDKKQLVTPSGIHHRHKVTPYEGRAMVGVVEATFVRGALVYERGAFPGEPQGRPLLGHG